MSIVCIEMLTLKLQVHMLFVCMYVAQLFVSMIIIVKPFLACTACRQARSPTPVAGEYYTSFMS